MRTMNWGRHGIALVLTVVLFATAFYISNYFNDRRVDEVRAIEDDMAINILSLETQFDLLSEHSCTDIAENSILSAELSALASRLSYMEDKLGVADPEVLRLKRYYSLLEVKDLLLMQKVAQKCDLKPVFLLYFYSNQGDCTDCPRQGYVLTELALRYPQLRIYSFDYHLDLSTVSTLIALRGVTNELPALVLDDKVHSGFMRVEDIEELIPDIEDLKAEEDESTTADNAGSSEKPSGETGL